MIKYLNHKNMGKSKKNLIETIHHFSTADYYNPKNINFGKLRVVNDLLIKPGGGYDLQLHRNLEILTYIIDGKMTHKSSLNLNHILNTDDLLFLSTGKGIYHSEFNLENKDLRALQFWILPNLRRLEPTSRIINTSEIVIQNEIIKVASQSHAPIRINQDINFYILKLEKDKETNFEIKRLRQAYLVSIDGNTIINNIQMQANDALEIIEENINIKAITNSHLVILEMKKE